MNKTLSGFLVAGLMLTAAPWAVAGNAVATVNGTPISQKSYDFYLSQAMQRRGQNKGRGGINRQAVINELVNRELLHQAAIKEKVENDETVAFQLKQLKVDAMIQGLINKISKDNPITDKELKKEYDKRIAGAKLTEYKARHILLKTEEEAKTVIAELDSGAKFEDLAKKKSTGPSAKDGGELGWFNPSQMVPPFSQAIAQMKKGQYSKKPVKTQFGWHVIKLEDTRKRTPPKFEDIKSQLRMMLQNQRIQEYITNLRKNAKIEIKK
ncbi:MAG TPA: peptidylprolyl isomerase [Gammaproteobacteria bacterium]|nr:peptidylprolyl isomerase [Gammaproteobacteria bacterium]